jgi:hypothetical protein
MADFDADGEQDAAVVSGDRSHFLFGNGDGTFTESHEGGVEVPRSFVVRRAGRATPLLLASTGLYGFRDRVARVEHTFSYYWRNTVLVADVNGDGNTDLLARDAGGRLSVILATRDDLEFDGFRRGVEPPGPLPEALATGDMNGDGLSDIVAAHDGSIVISHAAPSGGFPDSVGHQTGLGATNGGDIIVLDDFDGDRSVDVAVPVRQVAGQSAISVLFNAGGDEWGATILSTTPGTPWGTWAFASGDLDRDGDEDLIATVQNESTGSVEFFENDGSGHFATPVPLFSVIAPSSVLVADFDANGIPDVAVATGSTSPSLLVFLATGNRTFAAPRTLALSGEGRSMIVEDLNGDGALDLVVASTRNGGPPYAEQGAMEVFINDRGGAFAPAVTYPCPLYSTVRAADWNADGWKDLAVVGQSHVIVFRNRHDGTFETLEDSFDLIGNAGGIAAIDFNRDGHLDLVTGPMSVALGHFDCGSQ